MIPALKQELASKIFLLQSDQEFNDLSLQIFRYQYFHNDVYRQYVNNLGIDHQAIDHYSGIPFLPIEFFKTHKIISGKDTTVQMVFSSSGTSGSESSKHYISDLNLYEDSFLKGFELFYGPPAQYILLALLPSYLERKGSSLVYMAEKLIRATGHPDSGFYLKHSDQLVKVMNRSERKVLLLGVTFALLDLAEKVRLQNSSITVMETGGMKGRRNEMVREEVHKTLCSAFNIPVVHSEYGMTELLSQAYSAGGGLFRTPPWMKVLCRDTNDPLSAVGHGVTGGLNIIDLANIHTCSFIATQDLGKTNADGFFEVLGRFDASDIRGCNLMVD